MYRSIDEFTKRRDEERRTQQKKSRPQFSVSGRGIDAFFNSSQDYYQEADEDMEEPNDDDDPDLDSDMDQLSKDMEAESSETEADEALDDVDNSNDDSSNDDTSITNEEPTEEPDESEADEALNDVDTSDSGDDDQMKTFGQHGGDDLPNNQYDPKEIAQLMEFVSDEAKSLSDYIEAAKTSRVDILQRLYSDIADEERYHMEQLLFAKAEIAGEEYKPHDPDIRKEYEELLSMGMDESDAMHTAVDKFNIRVGVAKIDEDGVKAAVQDIQEACDMLDQISTYTDTLTMVYEYARAESANDLMDGMNYIMSKPALFQEDVVATVNHTYANEYNPFKLLIGLISGINKLIRKIVNGIRKLSEMLAHRSTHMLKYIQKHGIAAVFMHGPQFYLWNDKTSEMDFDPVMAYVNRALWVTQEVIKLSGIHSQTASELMNIQMMFGKFQAQKYYTRTPVVTAYNELSSLDPVKTKVIVHANNAQKLTNQFFSDNQKDLSYIKGLRFTPYPPGGLDVYQLQNCLNRVDVLIQATAYLSEKTEVILGELQGLENQERSIFSKNPRVFKNCSDYMNAVVKGLQKLSKVFASDFQAIEHLYDIIKN